MKCKNCDKIIEDNKKFCNHRCLAFFHNREKKGKTYEEFYGIKKALEIKNKISSSLKINNKKGKTFEQIYGFEKAIRRKKAISERQKGIKYEEKYGKERAKVIKEKVSRNSASKRWSSEKIINNLKQIGNIKKSDWLRFGKEGKLPCWNTALRYFDSLEEIAEKADIKFIKPKVFKVIGKNETKILDNIELEQGIKLERQYYVKGSFIDGYDLINNIAYEVDEKHHKNQEVEDFLREQKIRSELGCSFVRIKDFS